MNIIIAVADHVYTKGLEQQYVLLGPFKVGLTKTKDLKFVLSSLFWQPQQVRVNQTFFIYMDVLFWHVASSMTNISNYCAVIHLFYVVYDDFGLELVQLQQ